MFACLKRIYLVASFCEIYELCFYHKKKYLRFQYNQTTEVIEA